MRIYLLGLAASGALSLSACGGGNSSNPAAFCAAMKELAVKNAGLPDNPTPSQARTEANAAQRLAGLAPSIIKSAVKTEAKDYSQWAKTGNPSALEGKTFAAADDQLSTCVGEYCKQ